MKKEPHTHGGRRAGAGRRRLHLGELSTACTFRTTADQVQRLQAAALAADLPRSRVAAEAIARGLEVVDADHLGEQPRPLPVSARLPASTIDHAARLGDQLAASRSAVLAAALAAGLEAPPCPPADPPAPPAPASA